MFGVVLGLPAAMSAAPAVGVFEIVVAVMLSGSGYGLLKLLSWAPMLATVTFALAVPLGAIQIWLQPSSINIALYGALMAIAAAAILILQNAAAKSLYQPPLGERQVAS